MKIKKNKKIIIWLCFLLAGVSSLVLPENPIPYNKFSLDKILHFTFYFVLTFSTCAVFNVKIKQYKILVLLFILATSLEYAQIYIPHREFSYDDMKMNIIGIFAGVLLYKIIVLFKRLQCKK